MPAAKSKSSQTALNFTVSKRSSPAIIGKKPKLSSSVLKSTPRDAHGSSSSSSGSDEIEEVETFEEREDNKDIAVPQKRKRTNTKSAETKSNAKKEDGEIDSVKTPIKQRPELKVHDPRWSTLAVSARDTNGNLQIVHGEKENKVHDILRVFDLTYRYGPCYGISRIDRWERAESLGLNPPPEIRDILMTRQGIEDPKYAQCVFFDQSERI